MYLDYKNKILKIFDDNTLFSQIENMTFLELKKFLEEKGFFVLIALIGKDPSALSTGQNKDLRNERFMKKYGLNEDDIITLKLLAAGLSNGQIAERLGTISVDGVAKRVNKIFRKLYVDNRAQASVKAAKEGLV